jgi:hypothetical protein
MFRSRTASRLLYPVLRTGRNTVLRILGRSKLNPRIARPDQSVS